jgi:phosphatidylinositol glycan class X
LPSDADFIKDKCSLHIYYQLPSSVFIDPYELVQRGEEYTFFQWGHADLEKPVHAVEESNVSFLLNVKPPQTWLDDVSALSLDVKVPLHARYGIPSPSISPKPPTGTYHDIVLQFPKAFIACEKGKYTYQHFLVL